MLSKKNTQLEKGAHMRLSSWVIRVRTFMWTQRI